MNAGDKQLLKRVLKENEILKAKLARSEAAVDILGKAAAHWTRWPRARRRRIQKWRNRSRAGRMANPKTWKDIALSFAGKLITAGWSAVKACALVGVHRTAWYRHRARLRRRDPVPHTDRAYPNRITDAEADAFMALLNSREYAGLSVTQAYYRMLDAGHCFFSIAAAHRIVARNGQNGDRREQRPGTGPKRAKPIVHATAPNQLWSWDITMLHGPGKHTYRLYADPGRVLPQSRRAPRRTHRNGRPRRRTDQRRGHRKPTAPRRAPCRQRGTMRAGGTLQLAQSLGITLSYSRPRVSDDNPYSESLFKTVKYDLDFPRRFQDLQHAREYMEAFFAD